MISLLLLEITARYRIDPALMKRMATRDAPDAQPGALENTMQLDRLDRLDDGLALRGLGLFDGFRNRLWSARC